MKKRVKPPTREQAERDFAFYSDPSWGSTDVNKTDGTIYTGALLDAWDFEMDARTNTIGKAGMKP